MSAVQPQKTLLADIASRVAKSHELNDELKQIIEFEVQYAIDKYEYAAHSVESIDRAAIAKAEGGEV